MSTSYLEIIQLPTGEIVLQKANSLEDDEPLVNIRFSEKSKAYLGDAGLDIAKIMIQAGIQAVAEFADQKSVDNTDTSVQSPPVLH